MQELKDRGHTVVDSDWAAVVQAVLIDPDTHALLGACDPRKDGAPAGY